MEISATKEKDYISEIDNGIINDGLALLYLMCLFSLPAILPLQDMSLSK